MVIWLQLLSGGGQRPGHGRVVMCARELPGGWLHRGWPPRNPIQYSIAGPVWLTAQPIR